MNEKYKRDFILAGSYAKEVRAFGKSLIQPGVSYNEVIQKVQQKIISLGARAAFPPQIALNHVAAHFLPDPMDDIVFSNEVVKLDVGVCYNGAIGDCAVTVDLSGKFQPLINAVENALARAQEIIEVGLPVSEIGRTIEETIASHGFKSIKNLSGHGLGHYQIHTSPSIPNYDDGSTALVKPGMTFAIEPFGTDGSGYIYETGLPAIYSLIRDKPVQNKEFRSLLSKIKSFNGLPFAIHDLISKEFPYELVKSALADFKQKEMIYGYGPLVEESNGMVAQAENSILVDKNGLVLITTL